MTICLYEILQKFEGIQDKHIFTPKYLEVTSDQTLTFNNNLDKTGKKIRSRINLIQIMSRTDWGVDNNVLN